VEVPAADVPLPESAPPPDAAASAANVRRVLVVDDNEDAAEMLRVALEHLGYVVDVAFDGLSALTSAATCRPSTVLLDIGLPGIDGYEVARRLREGWTGPSPVHLIAVTGYGQPSDRDLSREAGFDDHLVKPIDLHELHTLLQEHPSS